MTQTWQVAGNLASTGLTAPGLVKWTAFKAGKITIFLLNTPFSNRLSGKLGQKDPLCSKTLVSRANFMVLIGHHHPIFARTPKTGKIHEAHPFYPPLFLFLHPGYSPTYHS
jgi:hypothetical protein